MVDRITQHKNLNIDHVWNAGDSFACGYGIENTRKSYPYMVADSLECGLKSLARPGCCNYTISKQIEYITHHLNEDDFVIVSTTNEDRISYSSNSDTVKGGITLERFNYSTHQDDLLTKLPFKTTNEIQSETISNILYAETKTIKQLTTVRKQAFQDYAKFVHDSGIKKDQDNFMLLWKLSKLNLKTKNWVCVTHFQEIHDEFPNNTLLINFGAICQSHPDKIGSDHFDETGHKIVYDKLEKWFVSNIERPYYDNQR